MIHRPFGNTGLEVSALGLGAGSLGEDSVSEELASELLNRALDAGVSFIDTARSYGSAEERIGRHVSHRRDEMVLSTKGGYGVDGVADWTAQAITLGIERALVTMKTDRIDVFHLHSCPAAVAMSDDILGALERARQAGKIIVAAYSGEGDALSLAVRSGRFGSVQCSVNLFDQNSLEYVLPAAQHKGIGVIAKRPLANAVWTHREWPRGDHATYWERMQAMQLDPGDLDWAELALRFSAFTPGVACAIVGTRRPEHLIDAIASIEKGPLPTSMRLRICASFQSKDRGWSGHV
jgi:aryl-alcohol dehydrogenase-like predicted oxidoreductase